jgi:hypothetical protein
MSIPVLTHTGVEPSDAFTRFTAIDSRLVHEPPWNGERTTISTAAGLSCARGALMALGIEMAAALVALCFYAASRL